MNKTEDQLRELPLRFIRPDCYRLLLQELDSYHVHAYDVKANARWEEERLVISLQYGEGMGRSRRGTFSQELLNQEDPELKTFFREAAEECKSALIADYYKLMKL